jgi:hypothetical protein
VRVGALAPCVKPWPKFLFLSTFPKLGAHSCNSCTVHTQETRLPPIGVCFQDPMERVHNQHWQWQWSHPPHARSHEVCSVPTGHSLRTNAQNSELLDDTPNESVYYMVSNPGSSNTYGIMHLVMTKIQSFVGRELQIRLRLLHVLTCKQLFLNVWNFLECWIFFLGTYLNLWEHLYIYGNALKLLGTSNFGHRNKSLYFGNVTLMRTFVEHACDFGNTFIYHWEWKDKSLERNLF